MLGIGESYPEPVEYLFGCARDPEATKQVRLAYAQLGSIISVRSSCKDPQAQLIQLDLQHARDQARLSEMELDLRRQSARQAYLSALASLREAEIAKRDQMLGGTSSGTQLKALQAAFLNSTSWRVTAPLRSVMRLLRREKQFKWRQIINAVRVP